MGRYKYFDMFKARGYFKGERTKHILLKFLFTHDLQKSDDIIVHKVCKVDCKMHIRWNLQVLRWKASISWSSKETDCTAMSTAEAEYVSLSA
ncbi:hypothetical protein Tco_1473643 [Tanacetum coccineum]